MDDPTTTGLHVCGPTLHRACVRRAADRIEVTHLAVEKLEPAESVSDGESKADAATNHSPVCVASIPAQYVMSRCWTFPNVDEARIRKMTAHRLEADLPLPLAELTWDCRMVDASSNHEMTAQVLAQASPTQRVSRLMAQFSASDIHVKTLTSEAEGLEALCRYGLALPESDQAQAVVLATGEQWLVFVRIGGIVRSVRRIRAEDGSPAMICRMCRQCLEDERSVVEFDRVYWCSSPESLALREVLAEDLELPVTPVWPVENLVAAGGAPLSGDEVARFGPAIGLALAGLFGEDRLIRLAGRERGEAASEHPRLGWILRHPRKWFAAAVLMVILALAMHWLILASETSRMTAYLNDTSRVPSVMDALQPKIRAMQRIESNRIDVEGIMASLCEKLPDNIVLSTVELSRGRGLVIAGKAGDKQSITRLANDLREAGLFARVHPQRIQKDGEFTITAELVGVGKLLSAKRGGRWP